MKTFGVENTMKSIGFTFSPKKHKLHVFGYQGSAAAHLQSVSLVEIFISFSWMSKPVPKQIIHLWKTFFVHY